MGINEGARGLERGGVFKCGLWVMKEVVEVIRENENLKREVEGIMNEDAKRKEVGVYENVKTWATIAKRITNERTIEKLERIEDDSKEE